MDKQQAVNPLTAKLPRTEGLTGSIVANSWHRPKRLCRSYGLIINIHSQPVRSQYRLFLFGAGKLRRYTITRLIFALSETGKAGNEKK